MGSLCSIGVHFWWLWDCIWQPGYWEFVYPSIGTCLIGASSCLNGWSTYAPIVGVLALQRNPIDWCGEGSNVADLENQPFYRFIKNTCILHPLALGILLYAVGGWVAMLSFGAGWHNNHHSFEYSARHGLEWWQVDLTWYTFWFLQAIGLATDVKLPTEAH
ncbi:Palmitoyl-monogalactosyldiacylglycerol delta-7 desaturase, chloroplastic-like protein [Drosera capensis]